jgi:hypothetical protein
MSVPIIRTLLGTSLLVLFLASGCGRTTPEVLEPRISEESPAINSLVVLPVTAPPTGVAEETALLTEGARVLEMLLAGHFLEHQEQVSILTEEQLQAIDGQFPANRLEMARMIGNRLESDAVLQMTIERYQERQGTGYSADSPASVAFRFHLLHVNSGRIICTGVFDETQQPLTSNLFALPRIVRRGFRWITAEELAAEGVQRELHQCEPLKTLLPGKRLLDKQNPRSL